MAIQVNSYLSYIEEEKQQNLHIGAFEEIKDVILKYLDKCTYSKAEDNHFVCPALPGHGKTTALEAVVKHQLTQKYKIAMLLVFNDNDNMQKLFDHITKFANRRNIQKAINFVNTDNVNDDLLNALCNYQIVCITQQRLRDLINNVGNPNDYMRYKLQNGFTINRHIIIDEMPIFVSHCTFNLGSDNNHVDWFDVLANENNLGEEDILFARSIITDIINLELQSDSPITKRLSRHIDEADLEYLDNILNNLSTNGIDSEYLAKFAWFKKLLHQDDVGMIDKQHFGTTIICAKRNDYRSLGNILILDGTAEITRKLYNNEYKFMHTKNYHDYPKRLHLHLREINTSSYAKQDKTAKNEIFNKIYNDIESLRSSGITPFPLMKKNEIDICLNKKIITNQQRVHFARNNDNNENDELPLNILNTTGKNILNDCEALALLSIPIRNPDFYKKAAISLYGNTIDLTMNKGKSKKWFVDERLEALYKELVVADMVQIIHRCKIRNINENSIVNIYLYTKRLEWLELLQKSFGLPGTNIHKTMLQDLPMESFITKCNDWAKKSREYAMKNEGELFDFPTHTAKEIGGRPFKEWLNTNWNISVRQKIIRECFSKHGLAFEIDENGYKSIFLTEVD